MASTKWAITAASIASVFALLPSALAKARTCAGLTTTTGSPALASPAATKVSKPPVASKPIVKGSSGRSRSISAARPSASRGTTKLSFCPRICTSVDFSKRLCRQRWRPSCPVLAQVGFAGGPSDCSGSMERRAKTLAHRRAWRPRGASVFHQPPHRLLCQSWRHLSYKKGYLETSEDGNFMASTSPGAGDRSERC